MKNLKMIALGLCGAFFLSATGSHSVFNFDLAASTALPSNASIAEAKVAKKIKVALLLDTSNSMDGLIDQAKSQLWNIVNELGKAKADNLAPDLQIALYQYGNDGLNSKNGFIQQVTGFTSNLDLVSEKLFSLTTNGGSEFCGKVIHTSLNELEWGKDPADYKTIFIAGNESFAQGDVQPSIALNFAKVKDVFVNTIYCGNESSGISEGWNASVQAAIGAYMNIDSDQKTVYVTTPYDDQIDVLNTQLNGTYVYYGSEGKKNYDNMNMQDNNASLYGQANRVDRALMKNGNFYNGRNYSWDLVDKLNADPNFQVKSVNVENLPEEMRKMSVQERQAYIVKKQNERASINRQIAQLGERRAQYIASEKAKLGQDASLQNAIIASIQNQAKTKGFTFEQGFQLGQAEPEFVPSLVNFDYFMEVAAEVKEYRKDRLVDFNTFLAMAAEPNTIILDTRSKEHYDAMHIKGAIHLNYSGFNVYDLARLIPDPDTRILIYCNNNIDTDSEEGFVDIPSPQTKMEIQRAMVSKSGLPRQMSNADVLKLDRKSYSGSALDPERTLALNVPTFINLYGYGYKNVYELSQLVRPNDPRLVLEGSSIPANWRSSRR